MNASSPSTPAPSCSATKLDFPFVPAMPLLTQTSAWWSIGCTKGIGDMKLAMAPCGIDCTDCALYRAAFDRDQAALLVPWFKSRGWIQAEEGVAEIMAKAPFCLGCRGDRAVQWSEDCAIRLCCTDHKGLEHCGECTDFPCAQLHDWSLDEDRHAAALEKLKRLRGRTG